MIQYKSRHVLYIQCDINRCMLLNYNSIHRTHFLRLLGAMGHGEVRYKPIKCCKLHVEQTNMFILERTLTKKPHVKTTCESHVKLEQIHM